MAFPVLLALLGVFVCYTAADAGHKERKINENGEYTNYRGYTVVCQVTKEDQERLVEAEKFIKKSKLGGYISALPHQSYHMTVYSISEANNLNHQLNYDVFPDANNKILRELDSVVETFGKQIQGQKLQATILDWAPNFGTARSMVVKLTSDHIQDLVTGLRGNLKSKWGRDYTDPNHITFAYEFKTPEEDLSKEFAELRRIIGESPITLELPKLCYFYDMKAFIPLNPRKQESSPISYFQTFAYLIVCSLVILSLWIWSRHCSRKR